MTVLKKARLALSYDLRTIMLLAEALVYLAWARIQVKRPFARVAPSLGEAMQESGMALDDQQRKQMKRIASAIGIVSRYTPWDSKCLARAIAGLKMLERRKIHSTLYLGTSRKETGEMIAHAWLRCGSFYVTGDDVMKDFTVVGKFARRFGEA